MVKLSAFADEISEDLGEELDALEANGIRALELRSLEKLNVLALSDEKLRRIREEITTRGFVVSSIGSPIGKVALDAPWEEHLAKFRRAIEAAKFLGAPYIRIFSYYPSGETFRDADAAEVIRRMREKTKLAAEAGVVLLHENEKRIYGETGRRCAEILAAVGHKNLRLAFDFANFVEAGEDTLSCWKELAPHVEYFHIKDYDASAEKTVPAGEGDGKVREILGEALANGFKGYLCLEPHLSQAEQFGGFTGPDRFRTAVSVLRRILSELGAKVE
ncbi:MAG: sugar phosphate isomerase/epimerase family protein [Planctomycetota bacterium]